MRTVDAPSLTPELGLKLKAALMRRDAAMFMLSQTAQLRDATAAEWREAQAELLVVCAEAGLPPERVVWVDEIGGAIDLAEEGA